MIFTIVTNYNHNQFWNIFFTPPKNPPLSNQSLPIILQYTQPSVTTNLLCASLYLPILSISFK